MLGLASGWGCSVVWRFSADEACAWMFYVFLLHGDDVRCMRDGHYMDKYVDNFVGGGVGIMECRHVRRYRGASVRGWSGTVLHNAADYPREPTTTLVHESASPHAIADGEPSVRHSCMGQLVATRVCVVGC